MKNTLNSEELEDLARMEHICGAALAEFKKTDNLNLEAQKLLFVWLTTLMSGNERAVYRNLVMTFIFGVMLGTAGEVDIIEEIKRAAITANHGADASAAADQRNTH